MGMPGIGAMLGMLGGNADTVAAVRGAIGRSIAEMALRDDVLRIDFEDGTHLLLRDDAQSCCESRYMRTDDDLAQYAAAKLLSVELRDAPNQEYEYGEHEVQFLLVNTSKGTATFSNHNEHDGYYGGFWITAEGDTAASVSMDTRE